MNDGTKTVATRCRRSITLGLTGLAIASLGSLGGCRTDGESPQMFMVTLPGSQSQARARVVTPDEFVGNAAQENTPAEQRRIAAAQASAPDSGDDQTLADTEREAEAVAAAIDEAARPERGQRAAASPSIPASNGTRDARNVVDAMVGQVNGRALYASQVLDPIDGRLQALGSSMPANVFMGRARELVRGQLDQIIADQLILGEAERDLREQDRMQLRMIMNERRGELLRQHGQGSPELADATLRQRTGKGLEETMREFRQQVLVQRYMRQKLWPRVNVSRRDVEREYRQRQDEYNPDATYTLHLISTTDGQAISDIDTQLAAGKPFLDVAAHPSNLSGANPEGLTVESLGVEEINAVLPTLAAGQHAGPIEANNRTWWVYVASINREDGRPLREVFNELEEQMRAERFRILTISYRRELFERGSYNDLDDMMSALMEVARSRYATGT